jgi:hypothetical protein
MNTITTARVIRTEGPNGVLERGCEGRSAPTLYLYAPARQLGSGSTQAVHDMQKALFEMNVQWSNVISDIVGETGLNMLEATINYCESASVIALGYVSQEHGYRKGSS